ncbi:MAG: hypothetical protein AVDCRST_MAG15-962, partial [uncultured Rubellimicrobium sp.]
ADVQRQDCEAPLHGRHLPAHRAGRPCDLRSDQRSNPARGASLLERHAAGGLCKRRS